MTRIGGSCQPEPVIPAERPRLLGFGGVAAIGPGGPVDVGGVKQRSVLALLMLEPGAVVPLDRLIDRVWAGEPPARAEVSVRSYISHVRALISHIGLGSESLQFRDLGYVLDVPPDTVDLHQFDTLVDQAAHETAPVARALLTRALDMYVGPPFGALAELLDLGGVTARYEERRGVAVGGDLRADGRRPVAASRQASARRTELRRRAFSNRSPTPGADARRMETQPDLTFYFAVHQAQRDAVHRYRGAVAALTEPERTGRGRALQRWAKGFALELDEHHYAEDRFFFPSLRAKVATATATIDALEADHRRLDELLARWQFVARDLADPSAPFAGAHAAATNVAGQLHDLLDRHLGVEDQDVLPLFWRHYTASEYDAVVARAVRKSKKAGMWFVAPFTVDCYPAGPERDAFVASVPAVLRLLHRIVRPGYDRLVAQALGDVPVVQTVSSPTY